MFKRVGAKIKTLVKVYFILDLILAVLVFGAGTEFAHEKGMENFGLVLYAVAGLIALSGWIGSFVLYGYGEMIDSLQSIEAIVTKRSDTENKSSFIQNNNEVSDFRKQALGNTTDTWICKNCKKQNASTASFCTSCGERK